MSDWAKRIAEKKINKTQRAIERAEAEQREGEKRRQQAMEEVQKKAEKAQRKERKVQKKKKEQSSPGDENHLWLQGVGSIIDLMDQLAFALKKEGVLKEDLRFMRPPARPATLAEPIEFGTLPLPNGTSLHLTLKTERKLAHRREYLQPLIVLVQKETTGKRTEDLLFAVMESGIVSPMMMGSFAASKLRRSRSLESVLQLYLEEKLL